LGPQTFAQTNASVKILVTDAIEDLQNNNTDTALTHLSLASEQLEIPSDGATTSAVSLNKTSALNTTLIEKQKENATITVGKDECTDNNLNGRCGFDKPKSAANICTDANHDLFCDWFRPIGNYPPFYDPGSLKGIDLACYDSGFCDARDRSFFNLTENKWCGTYFDGFINGCMANGKTREGCEAIAINAATEPKQNQTAIRVQNYPPFFDPGYLEGADYGCHEKGYNDGTWVSINPLEECDFYFDGFVNGCQATGRTMTECEGIALEQKQSWKASGEHTPQQTSGSNMTSDIEYCEDFNDDGFCDITHLSDGTTIIEDQEEIERLKEGNDGMPDTQQRQQQPSGSISLPVQPQQNRINWGAICRNPIVDSFISEPCETLTSPDGFTLNSRGQRVLVCLGEEGLLPIWI